MFKERERERVLNIIKKPSFVIIVYNGFISSVLDISTRLRSSDYNHLASDDSTFFVKFVFQ